MAIHAVDGMPGITIGADPELFVMNTKDEFVSAEGLIPGTKEEPYKVPHGAVQVDGMAAEFNIDPASSFEEFYDNVCVVRMHLQSLLPRGYKLVAEPSVEFSEEVWKATPDHAKVLGCSPDYNAWTGRTNPPPENKARPRLRCAGGHIHFGWTNGAKVNDLNHLNNCRELVQQLDWYLGAWSVTQDRDSDRRSLYGKAGSCRIKEYGVEYRVLSNFWLQSKPVMRATWNRLQKALFAMKDGFIPESRSALGGHGYDFNKILVDSINTSNLDKNLVSYFRTPIMSV